jgi:hypothetical protein
MVHLHTKMTIRLRRLGYWGSGDVASLPDPRLLADSQWSEVEREDVEDFLSRGFVFRAFMGFARCRICGEQVGNLELSDGTFCWPEGLVHYVREHKISLPREFIDHVLSTGTALMEAEVEDDWWVRESRGR